MARVAAPGRGHQRALRPGLRTGAFGVVRGLPCAHLRNRRPTPRRSRYRCILHRLPPRYGNQGIRCAGRRSSNPGPPERRLSRLVRHLPRVPLSERALGGHAVDGDRAPAVVVRADRGGGCHMPTQEGRPHRDHRFEVSDAMTRQASTVEVVRTAHGISFELRAGKIGHAFPTGDTFRRIRIEAQTLDASARVVERRTRLLSRRMPKAGPGGRTQMEDDRLFLGDSVGASSSRSSDRSAPFATELPTSAQRASARRGNPANRRRGPRARLVAQSSKTMKIAYLTGTVS